MLQGAPALAGASLAKPELDAIGRLLRPGAPGCRSLCLRAGVPIRADGSGETNMSLSLTGPLIIASRAEEVLTSLPKAC